MGVHPGLVSCSHCGILNSGLLAAPEIFRDRHAFPFITAPIHHSTVHLACESPR